MRSAHHSRECVHDVCPAPAPRCALRDRDSVPHRPCPEHLAPCSICSRFLLSIGWISTAQLLPLGRLTSRLESADTVRRGKHGGRPSADCGPAGTQTRSFPRRQLPICPVVHVCRIIIIIMTGLHNKGQLLEEFPCRGWPLSAPCPDG